MSDEWDIDSYKTEYENEEHWELRRNFMLAHKDKFSEDELVCLAQVFTNIEFLGCRYPEKTMIRVAELAKGVVENFREKRKDSLKRTFVAASDAASAKVKGQLPKQEPEILKKTIRKEKTKTELDKEITKEENTSDSKSSVEHCQTNNDAFKRFEFRGIKTIEIKKNKHVNVEQVVESKNEKVNELEVQSKSDSVEKSGDLKEFVLVLPEEENHPIDLMQMNASLNKCSLRWDIEHGLKTCRIYLNGQCVGIGCGKSQKISKEEAAKVALSNLRKSHYGIRMKSQPSETTKVNPVELGLISETPTTTLGEDNVGRKLMKLMGWQGGGLGSKEQGRQQPVAATLHVRRDGLGLKKKSFNIKEFKKHAKEYIQIWAKSDTEDRLVFSTDFTSEERKIMHNMAKSFSLKSKSYGKGDNRYLVISRRPDPQKILQELLKLGGSSDKYELLTPTKC